MTEGMVAETTEEMIAGTFAIALVIKGAIAHPPGNSRMIPKHAKVQLTVWPVCKQRQHHWKSSVLSESDNKRSRMPRKRRSTNRTGTGGDVLCPIFAVKPRIWIWAMLLRADVTT